ncbi:MAG TPA: RidA family protein [Vicinamibacterales bacterium]|nr:RidA family protein [Vicinamibacterales bacterium]
MTKQVVTAPGSAPAIGPYSPALRVGNFLFLSGQIPLDPASGELVEGDIRAQTTRVLQNLGALLKAGGADFSDVVRTTIFLADMNDFAAVNEIYASHFSQPYPARATVQVARLPKDVRVEIDAIAVVG